MCSWTATCIKGQFCPPPPLWVPKKVGFHQFLPIALLEHSSKCKIWSLDCFNNCYSNKNGLQNRLWRVGLQCVVVVFPEHSHLHFFALIAFCLSCSCSFKWFFLARSVICDCGIFLFLTCINTFNLFYCLCNFMYQSLGSFLNCHKYRVIPRKH